MTSAISPTSLHRRIVICKFRSQISFDLRLPSAIGSAFCGGSWKAFKAPQSSFRSLFLPPIESHKRRKFPYFSINNLSTLIQNGIKIKKISEGNLHNKRQTAAREYQENRSESRARRRKEAERKSRRRHHS
jgi:hypothetical protein